MKTHSLGFKNLRYYWRTNLAVGLGLAVASSVITGALLVGDSMRGSLQSHALSHLGRVDYLLSGDRFFREELANVPAKWLAAPVLAARGGAVHVESRRRAERIQVFGVDDRFWQLQGDGEPASPPMPLVDRAVWLNARLADQLQASSGDTILLRAGRFHEISTETLLGRRDDSTVQLRLRVAGVVASRGLGAFTPVPQHATPLNAYVPLALLQNAMAQRGMVNMMLVGHQRDTPGHDDGMAELQREITSNLSEVDLGLRFRINLTLEHIRVESSAMLLPPTQALAVEAGCNAIKGRSFGTLTHLANDIGLLDANDHITRRIPYSTVAAIDPRLPTLRKALKQGKESIELGPGDIWLNQWAADDLGAGIGDRIRLTYYVNEAFGELSEASADFVLKNIVPIKGFAGDAGLTPSFPGITDSRQISDWNPPFSVDLKLIRDADELYWDEYRATPKAFVSLQDGERLWAESTQRFGTRTSLQCFPSEGTSVFPFLQWLVDSTMESIDLPRAAMRMENLRHAARRAGTGSTDFGGLFIGFSFFLILSSAFLVILLLRLSVAHRTSQIGLLLALGFPAAKVVRLLLMETVIVGCAGAAVGLPAAAAYASVMLAGLRSWWSSAVNAPFLTLHATVQSFVIGFLAAFLVALISATIALRQVRKLEPRGLLAGGSTSSQAPGTMGSSRRTLVILAVSLVIGAAVLASSAALGRPSAPIAFFLTGSAGLVAAIAGSSILLARQGSRQVRKPGLITMLHLGTRNASRHMDRSLLTIGLIASATFVITALQAFRLEGSGDPSDRASGSGGYRWFAESAIPLQYKLGTEKAAEELNLSEETGRALAKATVMPFRLKEGDETSCLNLYRPTEPRILGASDEFLERGGFSFASSMPADSRTNENPWLLLGASLPPDVIPAIGDEASVLWQMHSGLGEDVPIKDQYGNPRALRFVGLLAGSSLQGEVIISESNFKNLFPAISGHSFFLIDASPSTGQVAGRDLAATLERELGDYGFDVSASSERITEYQAVQNTYLSTFQTLGGLGLVLGSMGLTAVLLRNIWERRRELALLQAVGFSNKAIGTIHLSETACLVVTGVAVGVLPALIAVAPQLLRRGLEFPLMSLAGTLSAVILLGVAPGILALRAVFRQPLITNLRRE